MAATEDGARRARAAVVATLAFVLVMAGATVADRAYFAHGYSATWYQTIDGERVLIDRTTEHRVRFPNVHRPLSRYLQGWPMRERAVPVDLPHIDVTLRASIEIPGAMPLYLGTHALREATVWADGEPLEDRRLSPGPHDIWIRWQGKPHAYPRTGRAPDTAYFWLTWGPTSEPDDSVPAAALTPADGGGTSRTWLWVLSVILGLLFALGIFRAFDTERRDVRREHIALVLTGVLVVVGLGYRGFDYDVMPEFRENVDELFATWNGWSLIEDGTPRGWSIWGTAYRGRARFSTAEFFGERRLVIEPYFEHPPLLHLLVGAAAHLGGAEHYLEAKLRHTRLVPIGLMAIGTVLMIAVGRRLWPASAAPYLGALFFSVLPNITMQTRVIKEETLLLPLLLGAVLFFLRWRDDGRRTRDLVFCALCAGLGTLAKVPGVVFVPAVAMLVAAEPRGLKPAVKLVLIGAAVSSLFFVYGALIDWDNFVFAQSLQGRRAIHWNIFVGFFYETQINGNRTGQGWLLFLWFGYAATVHARGLRKTAVLTVPPLVYLVAIGIGTGNWMYGWYLVPIYPFLCLGAGEFVAKTWRRPTFFAGVLLICLFAFYSMNFFLDPTWARNPRSWPGLRVMITLATMAGLAPFAAAEVWHRHPAAVRFARVAIVAVLAVVLVGSANFVIHYDRLYESQDDFDIDPWFTP